MFAINVSLLPSADPLAEQVPLARRGVQIRWLVALARAYGYSTKTTADFIREFVIPNTAGECIPLFARIPAEYRGKPRRFISHAWNDRFYSEFGTGLIAILEYRMDPEEYVWVDFACHNQHRIEQVPQDLHQSITAIGQVDFCIDQPVLLTRSWCVYELLTSHQVHAAMRFHMAGGHRVEQHSTIERAIDAFTSLEHARATSHEDKSAIDAQVLGHFSDFRRADHRVRSLLETALSDFRQQIEALQKLERGSPQERVEAKRALAQLAKQRRHKARVGNVRRTLWRLTGL